MSLNILITELVGNQTGTDKDTKLQTSFSSFSYAEAWQTAFVYVNAQTFLKHQAQCCYYRQQKWWIRGQEQFCGLANLLCLFSEWNGAD